jgi:hypothetical protein
MKTIEIIKETCGGCPTVWDVLIDGERGYIKYRWGILSLKYVTEKAGIFQEAEIQEQIGDNLDGFLELDRAIEWLRNNDYKVINKTL